MQLWSSRDPALRRSAGGEGSWSSHQLPAPWSTWVEPRPCPPLPNHRVAAAARPPPWPACATVSPSDPTCYMGVCRSMQPGVRRPLPPSPGVMPGGRPLHLPVVKRALRLPTSQSAPAGGGWWTAQSRRQQCCRAGQGGRWQETGGGTGQEELEVAQDQPSVCSPQAWDNTSALDRPRQTHARQQASSQHTVVQAWLRLEQRQRFSGRRGAHLRT